MRELHAKCVKLGRSVLDRQHPGISIFISLRRDIHWLPLVKRDLERRRSKRLKRREKRKYKRGVEKEVKR